MANMGPVWGRQDPGGPHVGPVNFVIWVAITSTESLLYFTRTTGKSANGVRIISFQNVSLYNIFKGPGTMSLFLICYISKGV